ncbi:MAG: AAA family ATPase, partial [bacterium]|nr:AAA family ATPase [bacterium]
PEWDEARLARPFADLETAVLKRRTTTLTRPDNHLLRDLGGYLVALHERRSWDSRADVTWRRLEASLQDLGQGFESMAIVERRERQVPVLVRRGMELRLGELSDGYQAFLVVVFDLLLRYLYLFPLLDDPLQGEALVVIDEVDLHLHPRWQRTVVGQLVELFPRTQFVLTAHSPAVVQGAIDEGFRVTVLCEKEDRATLTELEPPAPEHLRGAEIGSLWVDEGLFAVPSRYSRRVEAQEEEARRLREKIEAGEATEADRRQLISLLEELEVLQADDEKRRSQGPLLSELAKAQIGFLRQLDGMIQGGGKA